MTKTLRAALALTAMVCLNLTALSWRHHAGPQSQSEGTTEMELRLDSEAGIPFWVARNLVVCRRVPSERQIFVFMEPENFSEVNVAEVFRHLSDKYVHPAYLTVIVRTDRGILGKFMDLYRAMNSTHRDGPPTCGNNTPEDQLLEQTKAVCYQADYERFGAAEHFTYSLDLKTGERRRGALLPREASEVDSLSSELVRQAGKGCVSCVNNLLDHGAVANWTDKYGMSALLNAVIYRKLEVVRLLLRRGTDINIKDYDGWTPLLCAATNALSDDVAIELIRNGADVNIRTEGGDTALTLAVWMGERNGLIRELLGHGADFTARDIYGRTPLEIAKEHHHDAIIRLLEQSGAIQ